MKIKLWVFLLFCIVVESVVAYPFTLLSVALFSIFLEEDAVLLGFGGGIFLDLFQLRTLGTDSLFFVVLLYIARRYRKKIHGGTFVYRFIFLITSYAAYTFLFYKNLNIFNFLITAVFIFAGLMIFEKFLPFSGSKKRLAV